MSDLDRLMGATKVAPIEFDSYSNWISDKEPSDPLDLRKGYADYLRKSYLKADQYNPEVEQEIQAGLYGALVEDRLLEPDDVEKFAQLTAPPELSLDDKAKLFKSTINFEDKDWMAVTRYTELKRRMDEGEIPVDAESQGLLQERANAAAGLLDTRWDDVKRVAVQQGELAFASVYNEAGERVIIGGDRAMEGDLISSLGQSKLGGVSLADASFAKSELEVPEGFSVPRYKLRRVHEITTSLSELAAEDAFLRTQIEGHSLKMVRSEYDSGDRRSETFNKIGQSVTDTFGRLIGIEGTEQNRIQRQAEEGASFAGTERIVRELTDRLNRTAELPDGQQYTQEEVGKAYEQLVLNNANQKGMFEFHDGDDEVGKNIRTGGYGGPVVHPAAMANENVFNKMLKARPDIDDRTKESLRASRDAYLIDSFQDTSKLLGRSSVADEWNEALIEGRQSGKKNNEILNEFLKDNNNYSALAARAGGVGWSLWDAGAQLVAAVPAVMGADWAKDVLVDSAQRNSDRREVANLFGVDMGFGQDLAETVAPLLTDVAATTALATATAPLGGAGGMAYAGSKQGARLTAKGVLKTLTSANLRTSLRKGGEEAAEAALAQGLIRTATKDGSAAATMAAIKGYNNAVARQLTTVPAVFVPAATRSGAATYGSVTHMLQQDPSLSKEEIHDRALGAALSAGALTGVITGAFSAFGRGGIEDALLKGMSYKQAKNLLGRMGSTKGLPEGAVKEAIGKQLAASLKKFRFSGAKGIARDAVDEAMEEGIDQFINGFVEDAAMHENTPMVERFQQSMYAAALGGVMGAGATLVRAGGERFMPNQADRAARAQNLQREFEAGVTQRLAESGNPATAEVVSSILRSRARNRQADVVVEPQAVDTAVEVEGAGELEVQPEIEESAEVVAEPAPELEQAIAQRESRIVQLLDVPVGEKNSKRIKEAQREATRLQQEVDFIRETGNVEVPEILPLSTAPQAEVATPAVEADEVDNITADELVEKIKSLPEEEARAEVRKVLSEIEGGPEAVVPEVDLASVGAQQEGPTRVVEFATLFPKNVITAAEGANIDPMAATLAEAKHIQFFAPDAQEDVSAKPQRLPYVAQKSPQQRRKAREIGESVDFDLAPFRSGDTVQEEELAEASAAMSLAQKGYPVRFGSALKYGAPISNNKMAAKSNFVADVAYTLYPPAEINPADVAEIVVSSRKKTYFDPSTNKQVTKAVHMPVDTDGVGVFTNDPVIVSEMLAHRIPVRVPRNAKHVNPSLVTKNGYVTDVLRPTADGFGLESAVTQVNKSTDLAADHSYLQNIAQLEFIQDGTRDLLLPSGARAIDVSTGLESKSNEPVTYADLQAQVYGMLSRDSIRNADNNPLQAMLNGMKGTRLDEDFREFAIQTAATEYLMTARLYELRAEMTKNGSKLVVPAPNGYTVNPSNKKAAFAELSSRLTGNPELASMADLVTPMLRLSDPKSLSHTAKVTRFLEDFVLNNRDFDGNTMPTFQSVLRRARDRYAQQQRVRGTTEQANALVSIDGDEAVAREVDSVHLEFSADNIGGIDPTEPVSSNMFFSATSDAVDNAIASIEQDSGMRDALNDLAFQSIYRNPDANVVKHVEEMSTEDLMARVGQWMSQASHAERPEVVEFVQTLETGGFSSGIDLRNAMRLTSLFSRVDGDPSTNPAVLNEVRRQISESLGETISEARARNFIRSMDGAMRRRLSRAKVNNVLDSESLESNIADVERLGLESGNPESVVAALEQIAKSGKNDSHKLVAELLLEDKAFIRKVGFSIGTSNAEIAGEYVKHADGSHSVFLNAQKSNGLGLENVLLEEYVHAFLSDTLVKPESMLNNAQLTARRRIEGLYALARQAYAKGPQNAVVEEALQNADEFVANFLLDPEFQMELKKLETPVGQRGFFPRMIEALVRLFRKVTNTEAKQYSKALRDIIDLSKSTWRVSAVPFKQQAAAVARDASTRMESASDLVLQTSAATQQDSEVDTDIENDPDAALTINSIDQAIGEASVAPEGQPVPTEFLEMMQFLKGRVPFGVAVRTDFNLEAAAAADDSGLIINPHRMWTLIDGQDQLAQRALIDSIVNEELAHTASFGALTQSEINEVAESISDSDYIEIANEYLAGNPEARDAALARLASEDVNVANRQKLVLAEEKLRMHMQKVTRGYTTEEDIAFWNSKPSLLAVLKRYIGGVLNKFMANRRKMGRSAAMDRALYSVIQEMDAISIGFARTPAAQPLDPETPAESLALFKEAMGYDPLTEAQELAEAQDQLALMTSAAMDVAALSRLVKMAKLQMIEARINPDSVVATKVSSDIESLDEQQLLDLQSELEAELEAELGGRSAVSADEFDAEPTEVEQDFDLDQFTSAIESMSDSEQRFVVRGLKPSKDNASTMVGEIVLQAPSFNPEDGMGWDSRNSVDFSASKSGVIEIGIMQTLGGRENQKIASSFSERLITAVLVNNHLIGATKIKSHAAGSGKFYASNGYAKEFVNKFLSDMDTDLLRRAQSFAIEKDSEMNGYYSWPKVGFDVDSDAFSSGALEEGDTRTLTAVLKRAESRIREIDTILEMNGQSIESHTGVPLKKHLEVMEQKIRSEYKELFELATNEDGEFDLFYALHQHPSKAARSRAAGLWRKFGDEVTVSFDLNEGSRNLQAYVSRLFGSFVAVKQIPELTNIVDSFYTARKQLMQEFGSEPNFNERYDTLRDSYNEQVIDSGLLDFKLFTSAGQRASDTSSLEQMNFAPVVQLLEMPMFEYGAYKAPKGWIDRMFKGDLGAPIKQFLDQREEFKRASTMLVKSFKERMDVLVKEVYGDDPAVADWDLIAKAQGYVDGNIISDEEVQSIDERHDNRMAAIIANEELTPEQQASLRRVVYEMRKKEVDAAEESALEQLKKERDAALDQLGRKSPALAAHISKMSRELIEPIQKKLSAAGLDPDIAIKIDRRGGMYITRAYRMFNDPTFAERVLNEPEYATVRQQAMKFFENQLWKHTYDQVYNTTGSEQDAKAAADKLVRDANNDASANGSTYGEDAMKAFIASYDGSPTTGGQVAKGLNVLRDNMKRRKDIPKELRNLLGEFGPEVGTDLLIRTFSTVSAVAAQQTFLNNIATVGQREGFMVTEQDFQKDPSSYEGYVRMRNGTPTKSSDPLSDLYAPKELVEALKGVVEAPMSPQATTTAARAVGDLAAVAQKLTGKAMVAKTLGGVGFYLRNMFGNFLFFGPAQGYANMGKMFNETRKRIGGQWSDPNKLDNYLTELTGLGIIGDELHAGLIRELLNGKISPDGLLGKVDKVTDEMKVVGKTKAAINKVEQKLADLSAAIDGGYKIAYFEHELNTLRKAAATYPDSKVGKMGDYELKREAARKVKMTAQSLSQAPPIATELTKSGFGLIFAPFIRFKMEVPRIVINTYRLAMEEIRSDNPSIKRRGQIRFSAMSAMMGGISAAVPATLAAMSGIGDDEDEAMRKSMPEYLRGHTFWYRRDEDGNLYSLNLTYMNPFSLLMDPVARAVPHIRKGDVGGTVGAMVKGLIFDTYLDDQILAGNVANVLENRDSTTGNRIWIEGVDGFGSATSKALGYIFEKSYSPRILKDGLDALQAVGGDSSGFTNSPVGQLLDGAYPVKVHSVDLEQQYRRYIFDHLDRLAAVNKQKYELYSKESMRPSKVEKIYEREVEGRRALNADLLRVARGFEGLGIAAQDQFKMMKSRGIGKDKARLLFFGLMDRPDINKAFAEGLIKRGYTDRLRELVKARNSYNRYLHIEEQD